MPLTTPYLDVDPRWGNQGAAIDQGRARPPALDVSASSLRGNQASSIDQGRATLSALVVDRASLLGRRTSLIDAPGMARSFFQIDSDSVTIRISAARYFSWLDEGWTTYPPIPSGEEIEVTAGGSGFQSVAGSLTQYLGEGIDDTAAKVWLKWPVAVTLTDIAITTDNTSPGAGQAFAYVVQRNGVDTSTTLTIGGSSTDVVASGLSLSFAQGDKLSFKLLKSAGVPPARHSWTVRTTTT